MIRIVSLLVGLFTVLVLPFSAFAQEKLLDCEDPKNALLATCQASNNLSISGTLATVIQFLFVVAVILALGFLVYGGIKWITSGGDKGGVEGARNTIIASIIGLIVVFLAYVIINLVLIFLTGSGLGGITIPNLVGGNSGSETDGSTGSAFCGNGGQRPCGLSSGLPENKFGNCTGDLFSTNQGTSANPNWTCSSSSNGGIQ